MALIKCHECGAEISEAAHKCPHCGAPRIQTILENNSYVPDNIQNYSQVQPQETESNIFGVLSIILAALYFLSRMSVAIYWLNWYRGEYLGDYPDLYTITIADRIVTIILLAGFICTWCFSYKKEKNQKLLVIGTLIIAIASIVIAVLNLLLNNIYY